MSKPDVVKSFEREAWVIPNASGQLWTDRVFNTEDEALAYLASNWRYGIRHKDVKPTFALVQVSAALIAAEDRHG